MVKLYKSIIDCRKAKKEYKQAKKNLEDYEAAMKKHRPGLYIREQIEKYMPKKRFCGYCGVDLESDDIRMKNRGDPLTDALCNFCYNIV